MYRLLVLLLALELSASCSKKDDKQLPPPVIPSSITGVVTEINFDPVDITTPDRASLLISTATDLYQVDFNAAEESETTATISFRTDSILVDDSREFANLGMDAVAYQPVKDNALEILFKDGRRVFGTFDVSTSFGGIFGRELISQWRETNEPSKPNQKAKDDIRQFIQRYADKDGPGPETTRVYLAVQISKL
jgi:hypothetical protein